MDQSRIEEPPPEDESSEADSDPLVDDFDDEDSEADSSESELSELIERAVARCNDADIEAQAGADPEGDRFLQIGIPAGREARQLRFYGADEVASLLATPFERYRFVSGYDAICSYEDGLIEGAVRPAGITLTSPTFAFGPLFGRPPRPGEPGEWPPTIRLEQLGGNFGTAIELGPPSDVARQLLGRRGRRGVAVRLVGFEIKTNDQARSVLETQTDSLFFQIDAKLATTIELQRERRRPLGRRRRRTTATVDELEFPRYRYDREPMSLYWYGRGAAGMPLLQFLAYYQVIEFYFPVYAQEEVRRRLRSIVADPSFSAHADRDIGRLVEVLAAAGGRGVWGDERSQLLATLRASVDAGTIRDLITANGYAEHFERKIKGLTNTTLRVDSAHEELVSRTSERVYEIRCKIVHTKDDRGGDDVGLLLPFSAEAEHLGPDIELAELLARRVLAAASRALNEH